MKTVYCIQPLVGSGHHDFYADMYCALLLDLGYRVILLTGEKRETYTSSLQACGRKEFFQIIYASNAARKQSGRPPAGPVSLPRRVASACWRKIRALSACAGLYLPPLKKRHETGLWPSPEYLTEVMQQTGYIPDFLFILYFDHYINAVPETLLSLPIPWTGLLFAANLLNQGDYYLHQALASPLCLGLVMLDPRYLSLYASRFTNKYFAVMPDVADKTLSEREPEMCREIRIQAAGRTIVLLSGAMHPRKGIITLLKLARQYPNIPFFFVFCGCLDWNAFVSCSAEDKDLLKKSLAHSQDNCFFHPEYIENEAELNYLFVIADIIFAVYENFDLSSGIVGKAALFGKPILVQKGGLMEQLVNKGPSGEVVKSGNIKALLNGLHVIRSGRRIYNYETYASEISSEKLRKRLYHFMMTLEQTKQSTKPPCPHP
jgi:hypothetical protein